jgi:hypothetical protein
MIKQQAEGAEKLKNDQKAEAGLYASMFITFIQTKGLWPCLMEPGEQPKPILADELTKVKDEFKEFIGS